jgi:hypothetical protein
MDAISQKFLRASKIYNNKQPHLEACLDVIFVSHQTLIKNTTYSNYGIFRGQTPVCYNTFSVNDSHSRPVRPDLFMESTSVLEDAADVCKSLLQRRSLDWTDREREVLTSFIYTSVMAVSCAFDIWRRDSRKTPGTFFEMLMAGLFKLLLDREKFSKHIPLLERISDEESLLDSVDAAREDNTAKEKDASVSTDLVIESQEAGRGVVIPLKITTRERIVQPFAHQRILNSFFGENIYSSLIACISETQLNKKERDIKQICVPGTIKLFQQHLAGIGGLYYCDVPERYTHPEFTKTVNVKPICDLFIDSHRILRSK